MCLVVLDLCAMTVLDASTVTVQVLLALQLVLMANPCAQTHSVAN